MFQFWSPQRLVSNLERIQRANGIIVISQALLLLFVFFFLPESADPFRRSLVWLNFWAALTFAVSFYFTPLSRQQRYQYLPYLFLPFLVLSSAYALPTIRFYFLFLFFVMGNSYVVNFGLRGLYFYWLIVAAAIFFYLALFPQLSALQVLLVSFVVIISLISFTLRDSLFAWEIYSQRREKHKFQHLAWRLQKVNQQMRTLLASLTEGVVVLNQRGEIILTNRAARQLLQKKEAELKNRPWREVLDLVRQNPETKKEEKVNLLIAPNQVREFKDLQLRRGGETLYLDLVISPVQGKGERTAREPRYILTLHNVTEEKKAERMKIDFVSMAAHELRSPITAIRGYVSVLFEEAQSLTTEQRSFLQRALISTDKLEQLMENLLSVAKIERGAIKLEKSHVNWVKLVAATVQDFMIQAKEKGLHLRFIPPQHHIPEIRVDPIRINEVLTNLIANAINYTSKGKVEVRIDLDRQEGVVITRIADTGPGIPPQHLPNLFQKFYRVQGQIERGSKGTGLGLFISKNIVELHGGKIWVESKVGQGSTFSFSLPLEDKN